MVLQLGKRRSAARAGAAVLAAVAVAARADPDCAPTCAPFDPAAPVTLQQLRAMWEPFGYAATPDRVAELNTAMQKFEIDTVAKARLFMAEVALVSDHGLRAEERWGPSYRQQLYQGSMGNTEPGDAEKFKGAGYVSVVGRDNYKAFADAMAEPRILEQGASLVAADYPGAAAAYWWHQNGINKLIDHGADIFNISTTTRGFDASEGLIELYERAVRIWSLDCEPAPPAGFCLGGVEGECINTEEFQCDGATLKIGFCLGGSSLQCCPAPGTKVENSVATQGQCRKGKTGTCIDTNLIGCSGQVLRGYCPGGANVLCCPAPAFFQELSPQEPCEECASIPLDLTLVTPAIATELLPNEFLPEVVVMYSQELERATKNNKGEVNAELVAKEIVHNNLRSMRRSGKSSWAEKLIDGFFSVINQYWGDNKYVKCATKVKDTIFDIINYVQGNQQATFNNVMASVQKMAHALLDCSEAFCQACQWVKYLSEIVDKIDAGVNAITDCQKVYYDIANVDANNIDFTALGKDIGTCVIDIKKTLTRQRKAEQKHIGPRESVAAPAGWQCDARFFDDGFTCDQGCGNVVDPDCRDPDLDRSKARWHGSAATNAAPASWRCPAMFYSGGDGCDVCGTDGVGPVDPDCAAENATQFRWNDPAREFSVEFAKVDKEVHNGATTTEACQNMLAAAGAGGSSTAASTPSAERTPEGSDSADGTGLKVAVGVLAVLCTALLGGCIALAMMLRTANNRLVAAELKSNPYTARTVANPASAI